MGPEWECELCSNVHLEESHLEPRCVLCPRDASALTTKLRNKKPQGDFDLLSALKPTEGCRWAHILCSAWAPEVQYANGTTLKTVEGISSIADERWAEVSTEYLGVTHSCYTLTPDVHALWAVGRRDHLVQ